MIANPEQKVTIDQLTRRDWVRLAAAVAMRVEHDPRLRELNEKLHALVQSWEQGSAEPCSVCGRKHAGPGTPGVCDR